MADTTQFTIGTEASCSDGVVGKLNRVIIDPIAQALTYLVIEPEHRQDLGRLVPLELVDSAAGEIRLRCTKAEFEELDPAEENQFIPSVGGNEAYDPGQIGYQPYYGLEGGGMMVPGINVGADAGGADAQLVTTDSIPLGEVEVRRGDPVQATDGAIGHVQGLVIDPGSRHVTHVLLQEGHLWGRKQVAIPIGAVASTRDGIQLKISKQEVQDLPPVDVAHPEKRS